MIGYDGNMERYVNKKMEMLPRSVYYFLWSIFWLLRKHVTSQKCILFFVIHFWTFGKKNISQKCILFLWSIFGLLGKKAIPQKCILFFCDPFLDFWVKKSQHAKSSKMLNFKNCVFIIENVLWHPTFGTCHFGSDKRILVAINDKRSLRSIK